MSHSVRSGGRIPEGGTTTVVVAAKDPTPGCCEPNNPGLRQGQEDRQLTAKCHSDQQCVLGNFVRGVRWLLLWFWEPSPRNCSNAAQRGRSVASEEVPTMKKTRVARRTFHRLGGHDARWMPSSG